MTRLAVTIFLLGMLLLAACPSSQSGKAGTASGAAPGQSGTSSLTVGQTKPPAQPFEASSKLDVAGAMLDASPAMIGERYPPQGEMNVAPMWIVEGKRGMLGATMKDGSPSPAESAWFDEGALVGFTRTTQSGAAVFKDETNRLQALFGEPAKGLPDWAKDSEFAKNYAQPINDMQLAIWGDKPGRALLLLVFNPRSQTMMSMLVDVDRYNSVAQELAKRYKPAPKSKPQI